MPARVQAMIFDFDGTLARLTLDFGVMRTQAIQAAYAVTRNRWADAMPDLSQSPDTPVLEWLNNAHAIVSARCADTAQIMLQQAQKAIENVEVQAARKGELFPWTRTMLKTLAHDGIAVGVITRNCRNAVLHAFPDIMDYSACLLTRDDVPSVKPDPDHLLRALAHTGVPPEHSIMVGDHPMDIITGKAGGTLTAGVASGTTPREVLEASKPDYVAEDCMDLHRQLRQVLQVQQR